MQQIKSEYNRMQKTKITDYRSSCIKTQIYGSTYQRMNENSSKKVYNNVNYTDRIIKNKMRSIP
jgi:hypothetical protein